MKLGSSMTVAALMAALVATPALADPGNGKGNGKGNGHGNKHVQKGNKHVQKERHGGDHDRGEVVYVTNCPPGLAKKDPACIPPGQAKKYGYDHDGDHDHDHDYFRVGDVLRVGDYTIIRDLDRYGLDRNDDWRYYRDGDRAYRVDSDTRKILAVVELIDAFN